MLTSTPWATPLFCSSPPRNWSAAKEGVRLVMRIINMRAEFLERNRGLSREEKDGRLFKVFWKDLAKLFNSDNEDLLEFPGPSEDVARFESIGLSCEPTGYVATADILEGKFGSMRSDYMAINAM